jgi:hypothetical protein
MDRIHVTQIIILAERKDSQGRVTAQVHRIVSSDTPSLPGILKEAIKLAEQYLFYSDSIANGEHKVQP